MKYIRTKDGIYEKEKCCIEGQVVKFSNEWFSIINQADTIEELCDWQVYRPNGKIKYLTERLCYLDQCFEITDYENWYGAIDTDKGLIYVAKMNEKGCLELL